MNDTDTYQPISNQRASDISKEVDSLVIEATTYFNDPSIIVSDPSARYFFLLPKLHKPLSSWRVPYLHPKARPIISDTGYSFVNLS
jgi:hypothetical protein